MTPEQAEIIAIKALSWLADDTDRLERFSNLAGIAAPDILAQAGSAEFLGGVMDFLLSHEDMLLAFCSENDLPPEIAIRCRRELPGGYYD